MGSDQVSSLVNTAEVLAILKSGGIGYEHEGVQEGLSYLAKTLEQHLASRDHGPRTRYAVFTLLGLTEYPQARTRADVKACIEFAVNWLRESNRIEGGWSSQVEPSEVSLFATCSAIGALARVAPDDPAIVDGADCLMANSLSASTWPEAIRAEHRARVSPAITGLAALALFDAGLTRSAKTASRWLAARPAWWATRTEDARDERGTPWRHMSFSICARAVLRGDTPMYDVCLRPTLRHLDSLWSQSEGLWSDGAPEGHLTVRGAYAIALLYQELSRSILSLDPLALADTLQPDQHGQSANITLASIELNGHPGEVSVKSTHGSQHAIELEVELYAIVGALVDSEANELSTRQLCSLLAVKRPDLEAQINRLNVTIWKATNGAINRLVEATPNGFAIRMRAI